MFICSQAAGAVFRVQRSEGSGGTSCHRLSRHAHHFFLRPQQISEELRDLVDGMRSLDEAHETLTFGDSTLYL